MQKKIVSKCKKSKIINKNKWLEGRKSCGSRSWPHSFSPTEIYLSTYILVLIINNFESLNRYVTFHTLHLKSLENFSNPLAFPKNFKNSFQNRELLQNTWINTQTLNRCCFFLIIFFFRKFSQTHKNMKE